MIPDNPSHQVESAIKLLTELVSAKRIRTFQGRRSFWDAMEAVFSCHKDELRQKSRAYGIDERQYHPDSADDWQNWVHATE